MPVVKRRQRIFLEIYRAYIKTYGKYYPFHSYIINITINNNCSPKLDAINKKVGRALKAEEMNSYTMVCSGKTRILCEINFGKFLEKMCKKQRENT